MTALFKQYPSLKETLAHVSLGDFPTPVKRLTGLEKEAGIGALYIKRDDISATIYGGNKIRKLEFLFGEALKNGKREVMTFGAAGSNHALATAVCANKLGLKGISMLLPQPNAKSVRKNLLMSHYSNADLHYYIGREEMRKDTKKVLRSRKKATGALPEIIPSGGTSPVGTVGYVNAAYELRDQIESGLLQEPDVIYVTLGTMGTAAGLMLGLKAAGLGTKIVAVRVVNKDFANTRGFKKLFHATNDHLVSADPSFPKLALTDGDFTINHDFFGRRYALHTPEAKTAMRRVMDSDGVNLDGTYTGKTLATLLSDADKGILANKTVLFWNTLNSCDFSGDIKNIDYHELPEGFHRFFEMNVQPLDR